MPEETFEHRCTIPEGSNAQRLDVALAALLPEYSRVQIAHWIKAGAVHLDNQVERLPRRKVLAGQTVHLTAQFTLIGTDQPQDIPLNILFEDEYLLVLNKPPGLVVHPGAGNQDRTLVNALLYHAPQLDKLPRAGLIHRLDKDTSGALICAKTPGSYQLLSQAMRHREIHRDYMALASGHVISGGQIDAPIGRHPTARTRMAVQLRGRPAVTHYTVAEHFKTHTLLNLKLETGRTHQIRVHLEHIHHPILGDPVYAARRATGHLSEQLAAAIRSFSRQALHAKRLTFSHPHTGNTLCIEAPPPEDFLTLIKAFQKEKSHD